MPSVFETEQVPGQLQAGLDAGVDTLSQRQTITFQQYVRKVLPVDGWIFWLATGQSIDAIGSLHHSVRLEQREDETIGINRVTFTAEQAIQDFNLVEPNMIYIATVGEFQFAFSNQDNFYEQAGLFHYSGDAVYPTLAEQVVNSVADLDLTDQIVTNSLPVWLTLSTATVFGATNPTFPIYPSFLVPQDAAPPYASVHIGENDTEAIGGAPYIDQTSSHWQLCKDKVRITLYGVRNADALGFQDFINAYTMSLTPGFGVMNMPVIRDAKRVQTELGVIAQKKVIDYEISYYQNTVKDLARQFILSCPIRYIPRTL